jgi:hypothetical protein
MGHIYIQSWYDLTDIAHSVVAGLSLLPAYFSTLRV